MKDCLGAMCYLKCAILINLLSKKFFRISHRYLHPTVPWPGPW